MIQILSTKKSWIEGDAVEQLKKVHSLKGVKSVIGLPDLHAGPVGIAMASDIIYPHLVGNDIGCGMGFWQINTNFRKAKPDRWVNKLTGLETPYNGNLDDILDKYNLNCGNYLSGLGTIGLGNHFAELQKVEEVMNHDLFEELKLDKNKLNLLIHSGSRRLGSSIMNKHISENGSIGLDISSTEGKAYLENHDYAVQWARANRELISIRFMNALNLRGQQILDLTHNSVTKENFADGDYWVHRKGANPNNRGVAIIAGSRGTLSYLVKPTGDHASSNFSIAHGAGRKWKRSEMEKRLKAKHRLSDLTQTALGGRVICKDRKLLYEEAPEAYKNIRQVISDLQNYGLIEVIASYRPIITYKTGGKK